MMVSSGTSLGAVPMPTITVRNIPTDLYEWLKQSAEANRRSINSEIIILKEGKTTKGEPENAIMERQSQTLLQNAQGSFVVCLDRSGREVDSLELAAQVERWQMQGQKKITFIIGGPLGLSPAILNRADLKLSLSAMTFTHEMSRLLLLEQLYRACTIKAGEKYHK